MPKYIVNYRDEFVQEVEAENEEEAIKKANKGKWEFLLGEGHADMYTVEKECEYCGGELKTIQIGDETLDKCVDCGKINH